MHTSFTLASYSFTITKAYIPYGMAEKIKSITERFEEISNARRDLHLREEDGTRLFIGPQIRAPTSSHVDERAIFGRDEEKEKIISLLNLSNSPDFMVLPIVGMGGFGKTTLAQLVFNDFRIQELFNKKCWVSVSEDFDLVRLTKAIVESVSNNSCQFSELSMLQDVLKENIKGLGLFLVLDDVWNEKGNLWQCFQVGFFGAKFVRILTTTRNMSVAKIMQTTLSFQLHSLHEENCWSLFKHFALGNRDANENANLHKIGRDIVKKCKGSPLVTKVLGGILCYEMEEENWREILESDISEIDENGEIIPVLRLSYQKLPRHLKPCFLYLSMFPKDTSFKKDMVVRLWMAQGYINGNKRNLKTLEEIGNEYFNELESRSLVNCWFSSVYRLHDLIHDLARSVSHEAYQYVLENNQHCNGSYKIYHLYLTEQDELLDFSLTPNNFQSIRTVVNNCPTKNFDFKIFSEMSCVRALHLSYSLLPNKLGLFKHLCYLCVEDSQMEALPETLCLLYNLQTLDLNCSYLREIPGNIKNLINLRYFQLSSRIIQQLPESIFLLRNLHTLFLKYCTNLTELPRGIEQLTRMHIIDLPKNRINMPAMIGKLTTLKHLSGHLCFMDHAMIGGLGELKDMNKLSGLLCISGLGNIRNEEYSRNANLASKPNLHELILNFQEDSIPNCKDNVAHLHLVVYSSKNANNENDDMIHDVVLQSLQPHANLMNLAILNYGGQSFPSWLLLLRKLTNLTLNFCSEPNFLPPFGELPYLRFLEISCNTGVLDVGDELTTYSLLEECGSFGQPKEPRYPLLGVLSLRNMLNLVDWQAHDCDFPHLNKLVIENCPKLWKITTIQHEVREVTLKYLPKLEVLTCPSVVNKLEIHDCGFREIMLRSVSENLAISNCAKLISIKWKELSLNYVRKVSFQYCPKLELLSIPCGISKLKIHECGIREIMFRSVYENLTISNCIELISVNWREAGLYYVREVSFEYCPKLEHISIPGIIFNMKINECGFREIMLRSVSENLAISNCAELISINWKELSLNYVRKVSFQYCPKLELLSIPCRISKLKINECGFREIMLRSVSENLAISNCAELISINWKELGLNHVRKVSFQYCPKLELLSIPCGISKLKIHECGIREIMLRSVSENLAISNCVELISINWKKLGLNHVRKVSFEYCPKLELLSIPCAISKLKIHECGIREIMLRSVSENLAISNCVELISINWKKLGLNHVSKVSFECCPKLELLSIPCAISKLKIHECGIREIMLRSVSENLAISNCVELISINWKELGLNYGRKVSFQYCPKLELLSIPCGISKLKIHECGIREIMLRSVSENLAISNCVELISINWKKLGLNHVRKVSFEYCPKLELLSIPCAISKLKIHECDIREIMLQSVSENLAISNCVELISINWKKLGLNYVRKVSFQYCLKLELLSIPCGISKMKIHECGIREIMLRSVSENLAISNCVELISINWKELGLNYGRKVSFQYCPKLELLSIPCGISKLKIHECGIREIMLWSVSENLAISNCVELISINWKKLGLNHVRKVSFEYCPKLELITIPAGILKLKMHECGFREIMFGSVSEKLRISNCAELISINWRYGGLFSVREVSFENCPKLELITIPRGILNLKIHECGLREIMFRTVSQNLTISNCVELISIKWMEGGLNSVEEVSFERCPKLIVPTIPTGIKKLKISYCNIEEIIFSLQSSIQMLDVFHCPLLTSINWVKRETLFHTNLLFDNCPELLEGIKKVQISYCPILQFPVNNVLHSKTQSVEIYDCPRMHLGERYVYQRDTTIKELNLSGNNEIHLSDSAIPLLKNQFTLFLTKEDFQEVETLTCTAPSVGVSCQRIMLNLPSLVKLEILRCRNVISVTGLDNLSNLKRLSISYCRELCNWNDKTLPLSLEFLKLDSCGKLSSLPLLSVQNHSSTLNVLMIKKCPRLAVLEGFHGLMKLKTVELLNSRNISISPGTESLQVRPLISIGDCPLMRYWCQRNIITYNELIVNPQDDREAQLESAEQESDEHESDEEDSGEQESDEEESDEQESDEHESDEEQESDEEDSGEQESDEEESDEQDCDEHESEEEESDEQENGGST